MQPTPYCTKLRSFSKISEHFQKLSPAIFGGFFGGKKIFIVSEQKNRQKNYKQMLYTTYIIFS